jgi:hypothetical protein
MSETGARAWTCITTADNSLLIGSPSGVNLDTSALTVCRAGEEPELEGRAFYRRRPINLMVPDALSQELPDEDLSFVFSDTQVAGAWQCRTTADGGLLISSPSGVRIPPPDIIAFAPTQLESQVRLTRFGLETYTQRTVQLHLPESLHSVLPPDTLTITLGVPHGG